MLRKIALFIAALTITFTVTQAEAEVVCSKLIRVRLSSGHSILSLTRPKTFKLPGCPAGYVAVSNNTFINTSAEGSGGTQGAKGDKGDKGEAGQNGATGPQGPAGDHGVKGEKGDRGTVDPSQCVTKTSTKTVDYSKGIPIDGPATFQNSTTCPENYFMMSYGYTPSQQGIDGPLQIFPLPVDGSQQIISQRLISNNQSFEQSNYAVGVSVTSKITSFEFASTTLYALRVELVCCPIE